MASTQSQARPVPRLRLPPLREAGRPSGLVLGQKLLVKGISTATSHEQWPPALSQPPEPPVLRQPNPKGHYCSNCPREQCEALCGSTAPHCPADSGL